MRKVRAQMTTITDAVTSHAVTLLTDTPANQDALRAEAELTNVEIEGMLYALGVKLNAIFVVLESFDLVASA